VSRGRATGRRVAALGVTLALVATAAACAGDGGGDADTSRTDGTGASVEQDASAFPVTIDHMFGRVTIEAPPRRIVALGMTEQDIALALGFTPLAMVANPYSDDGLFPWASEGRDLSGVELVPIDLDGPSIERLAALEPDLVLATTASGNEAMYEEVVDYGVPILPPITGPMADSWQDLTRVIARALGVEDLANGVIAEAEAAIDGLRTDLPGIEGRSFTVGVARTNGVRVVNRPTDAVGRFFASLGMVVAPGLETVENDTAVGAVDLSLERLDLMEADALFMTGEDEAVGIVEGSPLFGGLRAVEQGTYLRYEGTTAYGLRAPTPLSVPYVLDQIRPTLERVASLPPVAG